MNIGRHCANFRHDILDMSLSDLARRSNTNIKTLSAFEHGKSSNIKHLLSYYFACDTDYERDTFAQYIFRGL